MEFQAIDDKVVAKIDETPVFEMRSPGGLIIPEQAIIEFVDYATVLSVGPQVKDVKVGDTIVVIKQKGAFLTPSPNCIKVYFEKEIAAIVKEPQIKGPKLDA